MEVHLRSGLDVYGNPSNEKEELLQDDLQNAVNADAISQMILQGMENGSINLSKHKTDFLLQLLAKNTVAMSQRLNEEDAEKYHNP